MAMAWSPGDYAGHARMANLGITTRPGSFLFPVPEFPRSSDLEAAMGLMDRVKQQASTLAQQANQGMAKLDNLPAQRRADALLRSLGVAILAERTGRATADTSAQITQ